MVVAKLQDGIRLAKLHKTSATIITLLVIYGVGVSVLSVVMARDKDHQIALLNTSLGASSSSLTKVEGQLGTQIADSKALEDQVAALQTKLDAYEATPRGPNLVLSVTGEHSVGTIQGELLPTNEHNVFVDIAITNQGDMLGTLTFNDLEYNLKLLASDGRSYFCEIGSIAPQDVGDNIITPQSIAPGTTAKGSLYFILDKSITSGTVYFGSQAVPVTIN